jgi:hypothetical protein
MVAHADDRCLITARRFAPVVAFGAGVAPVGLVWGTVFANPVGSRGARLWGGFGWCSCRNHRGNIHDRLTRCLAAMVAHRAAAVAAFAPFRAAVAR